MILLIYGTSSHGKTTIAKAIGKETNIPIIHVDELFIDWCKQHALPHSKNIVMTWNKHTDAVKDRFKEYLLDEIKKYKSLIVEGWQLESHGIINTIIEQNECVVVKMWIKKAYHKGKVIGDKDNLSSIIELCKFKE